MPQAPPANAESRQRILLIGHGSLVDVARRALDDAGAESVHLEEPADSDIRLAVGTGVDAVLVTPWRWDGRERRRAERVPV